MAIGFFIIAGLIMTKKEVELFGISEFYFLFLSIIIGPLILVNGILKNFVGRARPDAIIEFGGSFHYTKSFDFFANYCISNCSFVCGHCSAAFIMIIFAYLYKDTKKDRFYQYAL